MLSLVSLYLLVQVLSFTEDSDETLDFTENVDTLDADVEVSDDADVTEDTEA